MNFDASALEEDQLEQMALEMILNLNISIIETEWIKSFVFHCKSFYRKNNPFHNFRHALMVLDAGIKIIKDSKLLERQYLSECVVFAVILACLGHDLDHRGKTNRFEAQFKSELFQKYGDKATLEKHHLNILLGIIDNLRLSDYLSSEDMQIVVQVLEKCVMSTDLCVHHQIIAEFESIFENESNRKDFNIQIVLSCIIVHLADLSNHVRNVKVSQKWSFLCNQEFSAQISEEKERNYEISKNLYADNVHKLVENELEFLRSFVRPLWASYVRYFPEMQYALDQISVLEQEWSIEKMSNYFSFRNSPLSELNQVFK
jgi:hypothetical protein